LLGGGLPAGAAMGVPAVEPVSPGISPDVTGDDSVELPTGDAAGDESDCCACRDDPVIPHRSESKNITRIAELRTCFILTPDVC
jgi:hypothetical protein